MQYILVTYHLKSKYDSSIQVKNLPGAPEHETIDFVIQFDPRSANLPLGAVSSFITINVSLPLHVLPSFPPSLLPYETHHPHQISTGPQIIVELCADVTMPDICVSSEVVDFSDVICGQAKVVTVQLHNHGYVTADWSAAGNNSKDKSKVNTTLTLYHRCK